MTKYKVRIGGIEYDITKLAQKAVLLALKEPMSKDTEWRIEKLSVCPESIAYRCDLVGIEVVKYYRLRGCGSVLFREHIIVFPDHIESFYCDYDYDYITIKKITG